MAVASTQTGAPSSRPTQGRIFMLLRGVFALLGFGVALGVALPQAREALLSPMDALAWNSAAPRTPITALDQKAISLVSPAEVAVARGLDPFLAAGFGLTGAARPIHAVAPAADATGDERAAVTQYIAKRYRVADEVVAEFVDTAYQAGTDYSIDPLIVLAVMATESRYNPIAESVVGAKGLMQIIAKFHPEKLASHGGAQALFEPQVNIRVGTQILREYHRRYGDLETALQMYAGALDDADTRYARKVFAERARLQKVLARARA
jgi:soluble lytic murein transglycosylase-like protein